MDLVDFLDLDITEEVNRKRIMEVILDLLNGIDTQQCPVKFLHKVVVG